MAGNTFYGRAMAVRAAIAAAMCAAMAPSNAHARSLLYYYDFDKVENNALVYAGVNKGTGTAEFTLKQNGSATIGQTSGAFGSDHAFCDSNKSALWLGDGSASLGCGTTQGFTISFWLKASASHGAWSDFFGFRVGGLDYRCEYVSGSGGGFTMYYNVANVATCPTYNPETGATGISVSATPGTWQHVAFVFTPNGKNNLGTCLLYIGGEKASGISIRNAGSLQQIHLGPWVRALNGNDRKGAATNTGIDELAVFDYPATADQVKWLAKFRPGQPAKGPGREMPLAYLLDTIQDASGVGVLADNSGTGTDAAYKWQAGYANWPTSGGGALGSACAFHIKDKTTFRVDGASATDGLGAGLDSGMTLSFWIKAPASVSLWRDFLSFRIGSNQYKRFEWNAANPMHFTVYGGGSGSVGLKADTWQNVCMTWNSSTSKMEFYLDGENTGMTVPFNNPTSADVLKSLTFGPVVFNDGGGKRDPGATPNVYLDEIAVFNHSFSPAQIQWLAENVPCLPPLDATNLVRTVAASGAWAGGRASWGVREWDAENEAWTASARTTIYPALEDTEVEAEVTIADGVELTNDTFVTPKKLVLKVADGAASATLKSAEGSMFAPQTLEIVGGLQLAVPLYAVKVGGALTLGAGSKIVFDTANYGDVGGRGATALPVTHAMSVGSFVLPEGESDVLSHFGVTDSRFTLSLSADGKTILVAADTIPVVATWTGAGDGTSIGSAANWECRNAAGAKVDDALPCANTRVIVSSGTAAMNAPVGTTLPWPYLSLEAGSVTLAAETDWRGLPSLAIPEGTTISLGGNNLYLNGTVTGRGTFTDAAAAGGELHFDVADGATFANERLTYHAAGSFALTGTLKLVKDGAGVFVAARTGQTYSGGTDVQNGMFRFGDQPYGRILGSADGVVTVSADGTLDMNGQVAAFQHQFVLNGGIIQNAGADRDVAYSQFANIRLGADSTILPTSSMGVVGNGYAATTLDLGGHTLTIPIANGKALYLANTEIKNGLVDVTSGGWLYSGKYTPSGTSNNDIIATNADFRINGALRLYAKIKARSYEAIYAYDYNDCAAVIEVNGTFKPSAHDYFRGCTMMDGSIIDLSSRTNALPIVSAFTSGANTLAFGANKTVYVKFGGYHVSGSEPVISWAAKPVDIDTVKFRSAPGEMARGFITKDDGLYITCGFMILVR